MARAPAQSWVGGVESAAEPQKAGPVSVAAFLGVVTRPGQQVPMAEREAQRKRGGMGLSTTRSRMRPRGSL